VDGRYSAVMSEDSACSQSYGLALDGDESRGPTFETLAGAAQAAVEAVGPHGDNYTALILHFESVDGEFPLGRRGLTVLARVNRVDEHGAPTQAP
jgi:hypothetical protein